jgi:hypothetical protein
MPAGWISLGVRRGALALLLAAGTAARGWAQAAPLPRGAQAAESTFAATFTRLSEPAGFFDTDNLISNEASYLHVIPRMRALGVRGGVYIGVGPDQNYSYMAAIRPRIAYLMDVRRDNALQHLMFKALFARSRNRMEYLCRWLGRPVPPNVAAWDDRPIGAVVAWLDRNPADSGFADAERKAVVAAASAFGIPLSAADRETIARFHGEFIRSGLDLRFTSFSRAPRASYPTLRQLILERDGGGTQASYLSEESDWRFIKSMHARDAIIPLVGNLAGTRAFPALAEELRRRGERVSALYTSNVEYYLWREGSFPVFAATVVRLPYADRSVIIRSYFGAQFSNRHPLSVDGYSSTQLLQPIDDFARRIRAGEVTSYWELVSLGAK